MFKTVISSFSILLLLLSNTLLAGGFHYEIDAQTRLVSNDSGYIKGLEMTWVYDAAISDLITQDEDLSTKNRDGTLKSLAILMVEDLHDLNYFTSLLIDGKPAIFAEPTHNRLEMLNGKQLKLTFFLPLATPLAAKNIDLALADPNGAGVVIYNDDRSITFDEKLQKRCNKILVNHEEFEHGQAAQIVKITCQ